MTNQQYSTLLRAVRDVGTRVERVEERLAFEFPTDQDAREQIQAELDAILAPGGGVRVFADD